MLSSLDSAVTGLQQFQNGLDVIGNNIANSNTTGYKSGRIHFEDSFSQTLQAATGSVAGAQVGSGVNTSSITNDFTPGTISGTGVSSDLAIYGEGFFIVKDPASGQEYATRAGDFTRDANGYLVTSNGYRLQGFSDAGLTTRGDVQVDRTGMPATADPQAEYHSFFVATDGKIQVELSDGTVFSRGQVLLQKFNNPQALLKSGNNLYTNLALAGPLTQTEVPGTAGVGSIQGGALELSNVDLTVEFSQLIKTQRAFQANARMVTTSDEVLQELVNLKR